MKSVQDKIIMANGKAIPCVGYGTWQTPDGDTAKNCVKYALQAGYRHIDTAACYGNEVGVGEGIRASGVRREDIFLTTKHWVTERGYEKTIAAAEASMKALGVDYLDLYLIHWPCVAKVSEQWREINADTWRGFEKLYRDGKILSLGVSNFEPHHLAALDRFAEVKPVVNQIEFHPGYNQLMNVKYCQEMGLTVEAWSPLGCGKVLGDAHIVDMAKKYGVTPAKICIRYALQHGVLPLPKSVTPERITDNMDVFSFEISAEDMLALDKLPLIGESGFYADDGPAETYYD